MNEPAEIRLRKRLPVEAGCGAIRTEGEVVDNADRAIAIREAADWFDAHLPGIGADGHSGLMAAAPGSGADEVIARSSHPAPGVSPASS